MKRSGSLTNYRGKIMLPFLLALLFIFVGCSSSHHVAKGKHGQVPCPCEKKSNHR